MQVSMAAVFAVLFVFGLLIGSFLNVVIWRLPRGENLSHPGSHCPRCDHPIRPRDNIPVLSWLLLRGRCRDCSAPISPRYPAVELVTGIAFGITGAAIGLSVLLLPMLWFVAVAIAIFMIDIDLRRIPNAIVVPSWLVVAAGLAITAAVEATWSDLWRALAASAAMGAAYLALALVYPGGMGMGDVKLALLLGLVLGWFGWPQVIVGFFAGFLLGAVWGAVGMLTGRAGRKTALPFAPFMIAGTFLALFVGEAVGGWYVDLL